MCLPSTDYLHKTLRLSLLAAVAPMMYSFGDVFDPQTDTVQVMEDLLTDYITDLVRLTSLGLQNA